MKRRAAACLACLLSGFMPGLQADPSSRRQEHSPAMEESLNRIRALEEEIAENQKALRFAESARRAAALEERAAGIQESIARQRNHMADAEARTERTARRERDERLKRIRRNLLFPGYGEIGTRRSLLMGTFALLGGGGVASYNNMRRAETAMKRASTQAPMGYDAARSRYQAAYSTNAAVWASLLVFYSTVGLYSAFAPIEGPMVAWASSDLPLPGLPVLAAEERLGLSLSFVF